MWYNLLEDQKLFQDNIVGSLTNIEKAYIAGFLDGDGSLMLQIKKRKDGKLKRRFMTTICFYQDTRHEKPLHWIRDVLGIGYISRRNDGMSELRINGFSQVRDILINLLPHMRFKKKRAESLCKAATLLSKKKINKLTNSDLKKILSYIIIIQKENYVTKRKKSRKELAEILGIAP